jgi:hypothetical protein
MSEAFDIPLIAYQRISDIDPVCHTTLLGGLAHSSGQNPRNLDCPSVISRQRPLGLLDGLHTPGIGA